MIQYCFVCQQRMRGWSKLRREAIMLLFFERPDTEEEVQICQQDKRALAIEHGDDREHPQVIEKIMNNELLWFTSGHMSAIV